MNNVLTASSTDISSLIGALELGDYLTSHSDGMLEAMAGIHVGQATQISFGNCTVLGRCATDGVLEFAGAGVHPGPTIAATGCMPPTQLPFSCR